jgi:outer membrane biosynthesis protein TonB
MQTPIEANGESQSAKTTEPNIKPVATGKPEKKKIHAKKTAEKKPKVKKVASTQPQNPPTEPPPAEKETAETTEPKPESLPPSLLESRTIEAITAILKGEWKNLQPLKSGSFQNFRLSVTRKGNGIHVGLSYDKTTNAWMQTEINDPAMELKLQG